MHLPSRVVVVIAGLSCVLLAGCAAGSSGSSAGTSSVVSGTFGVESGDSGPLPAATGDCGISAEFNINVERIADLAGRVGVGPQTTPVAALRASLARGTKPYYGGTGGSGLAGEGYPTSGWTEVSVSSDRATFKAPLHSGTAQLTITRVDTRWMVSAGKKDC